jgi:hypothetical protein
MLSITKKQMNRWAPRKKIRIFAFLGSMALLLLYPFKTTVVPDWRVRIVDEEGNPIRMAVVKEVWQHSTIESASHEEDSITDNDGYVTFPRRTVRGSLLVRIGTPIVNLLNVHASFGPIAYVLVVNSPSVQYLFQEENHVYFPDKPLPAEIVLKRVQQ